MCLPSCIQLSVLMTHGRFSVVVHNVAEEQIIIPIAAVRWKEMCYKATENGNAFWPLMSVVLGFVLYILQLLAMDSLNLFQYRRMCYVLLCLSKPKSTRIV